jgi:cytochrome c-type biogenesis protein CcmF
MTPFLGRSLVLLSLLLAVVGAMVAFAAGARQSRSLWNAARRMAYGYAAAIIAANGLMIWALIAKDFSVSYVAQVGSRSLPLWVSIVSLWSSLEGSILFWGLVLGIYIASAIVLNHGRYEEYLPYATGVWLATAAFFSFLIAGPAQPFNTVSPVPFDGPGPNPLLQNHILMAIHPPFLYLGYVGLTIPFGFASAALLRRRLGHGFLSPLRSSILLPWCFLSIAIVLGGWWAYEVLGWGGYWAWDPVENASFLPWLTATAALHSAIVVERRGTLKGWTVTLILASFLLTILGTFMTRSGVFNSVHSFTQSSIGPTILVFLAAGLLWSVVLLAWRIDTLREDAKFEKGMNREVAFLGNNLLFVLLTFTVLVGTVFPLLVEAARGAQMSVGRPYFDKMAVPIGVALLFLMGVGPALPWGRATRAQLKAALVAPSALGVVFAAVGVLFGVRNFWTYLALFFGGYTTWVTLQQMLLPMRQRMRGRDENVLTALVEGGVRRGQRRLGAYIAHAGAVVIIISIAVSSTMATSREVQLKNGESASLGKYNLRFVGTETRTEPHRQSVLAHVEIWKGGRMIGLLSPRMNYYERQPEPIGTPAVRTTLTHDIYLSAMNIDTTGNSIGLHAMINPMVGWIWAATGIMALGGFFALASVRRRSSLAVATTRVAADDAVAGEA